MEKIKHLHTIPAVHNTYSSVMNLLRKALAKNGNNYYVTPQDLLCLVQLHCEQQYNIHHGNLDASTVQQTNNSKTLATLAKKLNYITDNLMFHLNCMERKQLVQQSDSQVLITDTGKQMIMKIASFFPHDAMQQILTKLSEINDIISNIHI
jgi:hypothetical protein